MKKKHSALRRSTAKLTAAKAAVGRRNFLKGSAGLAFGVAFGPGMAVTLFDANAQMAKPQSLQVNAWITIATNGTITLISPASEMGQGTFTSMPMILAEELDSDWNKVKVVQAPANAKAFGNPLFGGALVTGASRTARGYWPALRMAGAQARRVLLENAAQRWGVPVAELTTEPSYVVHGKTGRRLGYGEIAQFGKIPAEMPKLSEQDLKPRSDWRYIGHDMPRIDVPLKSNGSAKFGIDVNVPGMLYATILRWPVQGNGPDKIDDTDAMKVKGVVKIVPLPHGVGVVAANYPAALKGREALKVSWKKGAKAETYDSDKVAEDYLRVARNLDEKGVTAFQSGNIDDGLKSGAKMFTAEYVADHVHHMCMEPMNCTAWVKENEVEVWTPTQGPSLVVLVSSRIAGVTPDRVTVHTTFLGGGFGRRIEQDTTIDAVSLSKAVGKPVKVIWTREEDVKNGKYRPLIAQRLDASLDSAGKIVGWRHRMVSESIYARANPAALQQLRGIDAPVVDGHQINYAIPNQLHQFVRQERGIDVGFWRSVGPGYTVYAIETFMDELAKAAGKDPIEFRLMHLTDERAKQVIRAAAHMAEWSRKRTNGRVLGFAYASYQGFWQTHIAEVVEISFDRSSGKVRVHKVWAAADPGVAIHPNNIVLQIEGGIVHGVSQALYERITIKNGEVQESNFHDYPILRIDEAPEVEVRIIASNQDQVGGMGEVSLPPVAPAIANAVFAATGKMVRHQPMLPERVKDFART